MPNLAYGEETIESLIYEDGDEDGISDWEEKIWNTDPAKKDTDDDGTSDGEEIRKLKADSFANASPETEESLTETDIFSRELFSTVASLTEAGAISPEMVSGLTGSLAEQITNYQQKKVYSISDLKITSDNSAQSAQKYSAGLSNIYLKYPISNSVIQVLERLTGEEGNAEALSQLDPIINQSAKIVSDLVKMEVPQYLSSEHLNLVNSSQLVIEDMENIKFFESDPILAFSALNRYESSVDALQYADGRIRALLQEKLSN